MERIDFKSNWNGKLALEIFPTVRIPGKKYNLEQSYEIFLNDKFIGIAKLIHCTRTTLEKVTEGMALIDTGYSRAKFIGLVNKMYPQYIAEHGNSAIFGMFFFQWISRDNSKLPELKKIG